MKRKIGIEVYMSLFLILETIVWFILKIANVMEVEWWHILYTNLLTFAIYTLIFNRCKEAKKIMMPFCTMVFSCLVLGIIFILIPHLKEVSVSLKIWLFFLITLIIVTICIYITQSIKNSMEIKEIENNYKKDIQKYEYYREIVNQFSPAILSLVYNRKIKYSDTLVATILDLKLKGYIDIQDKGIMILEKDTKDLLPNQKFIYEKLEERKSKKGFVKFENIANIFSNVDFKKEWKETIKEEAEEKNLCSSKLVIFDLMQKISIISFFALIAMPILIMIYKTDFNERAYVNIVTYLIVVVIHSSVLFFTAYLHKFNRRNLFVRTKEGVELQCKLSGLKNYIKDYSQLEERDLKELVLWEDYLIYAIIFDLKGNLDKEAEKLYEKLIND